jgi:hypothetical protein
MSQVGHNETQWNQKIQKGQKNCQLRNEIDVTLCDTLTPLSHVMSSN